MRKSISWILDFTSKLPNDEERVKCLRANDNNVMRTILNYALNPNIKWIMPEGRPPYTPNEHPHQENVLYSQARKLYLFIEGGAPNVKPIQRERLFIDLLESLDPRDAEMICEIKDKKMPFENITVELVREAYPGIF